MPQNQARILIDSLDVPECGCEVVWRKVCRCAKPCDHPQVIVSPPCRHVLAADHEVPIPVWINILLLEAEYADPPRAPSGAAARSRQARIAVYIERAAANRSLWHPDDYWSEDEDDSLKVANVSQQAGEAGRHGRLVNGRPNPNETLTSTTKESA